MSDDMNYNVEAIRRAVGQITEREYELEKTPFLRNEIPREFIIGVHPGCHQLPGRKQVSLGRKVREAKALELKMCEEPELLGIGTHLLCVARRT